MSIRPGQDLLHYRIVQKIGEGGMGEVWRAVDTTLDRDVAIKFLPVAFADHAERLQRFEREAKTLAGLNHPGIAGIYGLHEVDGLRFIAMELVEGEDLSERVGRGRLSLEDALDVARQVARALEAAHETGVVHRDLKPANVRITHDGTVKVLDFGLAKVLDPEDSRSGSGSLSMSPTATSGGTVAGAVLGTAGYMAPEQAKGKAVDRRADVWAFGCVLFEMLTGRRPFQAESVTETLAAVLMTDPDLAAIPDDVPPAIRWLLQRCLDKDPRTRLRDIGEAHVALSRTGGWMPPPADAEMAAPSPRPGWLWPAVASVLAVVAFAVGGALRDGAGDRPAPLRKFEISQHGVNRNFDNPPMLSPDGGRIAYVRDGAVWVRDLARLEPRLLIENGDSPFWSPDGSQLAFDRGDKLWRVDANGGEPTLICDLPVRGAIVAGAWAPDGTIWLAAWRGGLYRVPARGGDPELALEIRDDEVDFHDVTLLPDGETVLYSIHHKDPESGAWLAGQSLQALAGGERRDLDVGFPEGASFERAMYGSGHLVFERTDSSKGIWAVPFDPDRLEAVGAPFLVVADGMRHSVSGDGTLTYLPGSGEDELHEAQLTWVDRRGEEIEAVGEPRRMSPQPSLSPDGNRVVVALGDTVEELDLWVFDLARGGSFPLTRLPGSESFPVWSADGSEIVFQYVEDRCGSLTCTTIGIVPADGSREPEFLGNGVSPAPTPDGREIVYTTAVTPDDAANDQFDLVRRTRDGDGEAVRLTRNTDIEFQSRPSPDGRLLAYFSGGRSGRNVLLSPFPAMDRVWRVSPAGGAWPVWNAAGDRLYYVEDRRVLSVEVDVQVGEGPAPAVKLGAPRPLFELDPLPGGSWRMNSPSVSVSEDESRFLVARAVGPGQSRDRGIVVVQNWLEEFESR